MKTILGLFLFAAIIVAGFSSPVYASDSWMEKAIVGRTEDINARKETTRQLREFAHMLCGGPLCGSSKRTSSEVDTSGIEFEIRQLRNTIRWQNIQK